MNTRIIVDSYLAILQSVENEPDPVEQYRMCRIIREHTDTHLRNVEGRAAYNGARDYGVTAFAERVGVARSTIYIALRRHMDRTGAPEFRPSSLLKKAVPFDVTRRRR